MKYVVIRQNHPHWGMSQKKDVVVINLTWSVEPLESKQALTSRHLSLTLFHHKRYYRNFYITYRGGEGGFEEKCRHRGTRQ
jgi:hypothetical protein